MPDDFGVDLLRREPAERKGTDPAESLSRVTGTLER
jgi:hypothetical protein